MSLRQEGDEDEVFAEAAVQVVFKKRCFENMQQICRTPMTKCDFNKVALQLY